MNGWVILGIYLVGLTIFIWLWCKIADMVFRMLCEWK